MRQKILIKKIKNFTIEDLQCSFVVWIKSVYFSFVEYKHIEKSSKKDLTFVIVKNLEI